MICPLCQKITNKIVFVANEFHGQYSTNTKKFNYYQCQNCHSIFPDIININISNYYHSNYRHKINILDKILIKIGNLYQKKLIHNLFNKKDISILDIGCGNGLFLNNLPPFYRKTGIDIKIDTNQNNLIQADFLKYNFEQKFDLITFWHSLEHLSHPIKALKKAKKILKHGGVIIINIPVSDSYSFKISPSKAFHLDPPRHVFIPNSIKFNKILLKIFKNVNNISNPFEFPLDLLWTLKNSHQKYLIPLFPILKIIKPETKLFICRR